MVVVVVVFVVFVVLVVNYNRRYLLLKSICLILSLITVIKKTQK